MAIFVCKFDFFHKSDQITLKQGGCVQKSNLAIFYSQVIFARKNITAIRAMRTFFCTDRSNLMSPLNAFFSGFVSRTLP